MIEGMLTILGSVLLGMAVITSIVLWLDKQERKTMQSVLIRVDEERHRKIISTRTQK